jgi:hypothetical protein
VDEVEEGLTAHGVGGWDQWLSHLITIKRSVYTLALSVIKLKEFGQLGDVLAFRIDNQVQIVITLFAGILFTPKILVDLLTQGFYVIYEQMEREEGGTATAENARLRSRPTETTNIADTHERHNYDQAFM